MPKYELVLRKDGQDVSSYAVGSAGLVFGRAGDCDVVLPDSLVSRRHARVWLEENQLMVSDFGSRNGVLVNGARVERLRIDAGDEVVLGNYLFVVAAAPDDTPDLEGLSDTGSMITSERAHALYEEMIRTEGSGRLPILYKAAQLLGSVFDLDDLLEQILALIFESLPAQRGYILTLDKENGDPVVRASRSQAVSGEGPPISQTLVRHVFGLRNAILTSNAQTDSRFEDSVSVIGYHIRAAMCAPLLGRHALTGVIYIDSGAQEDVFTNEDLELLTALGRVVGVAVENAQLYAEAVERERLAAVGQATTGIGHCVKNMLVGIKGGGEFVELGLERKDWKWVDRGWPLIKQAADRVEALVMNLLAFSRDRKPDIEPTDLNSIVREVLALVAPGARKAGIELVHHEGNHGVIHLDGREIYRVVLNLVANAVEACESSGGTVTVSTRRDSSGFYIDVADTGVGVPEAIRPKLFQLFVSSKAERGTGLGLACCDKIVRAHGGQITYETDLGKGSTFTVCLPPRTIVSSNQATQPIPVREE
jgi:signal transduction histidine kinase